MTKGRVRRGVLASFVGAASAVLMAFVGWAALGLIPGTPSNALLRGAISAAGRGEGEFLRYLLAPETEAQYRAGVLWYDLTVLPMVVIAGSLVAAALSSGSWLCAALGGMVPALVLTLVGPLGDTDSGVGLIRVVLVVGLTWTASLKLRRLWEGRRSRERPSTT